MDKAEARAIQQERIDRLRQLEYPELVDRLIDKEPVTEEVTGSSGKMYQLEIQGFWDGKPDQDLRVMVNIDDGGWRAFKPLAADFIIAPDGTFVGE